MNIPVDPLPLSENGSQGGTRGYSYTLFIRTRYSNIQHSQFIYHSIKLRVNTQSTITLLFTAALRVISTCDNTVLEDLGRLCGSVHSRSH